MYKFLFLFWLLCIGICCNDTRLPLRDGTSKIVLVTVDGVRWQDIFDDSPPYNFPKQYSSRQLVPNLYRHFVDGGLAIGKLSRANLEGPAHISQPSYIEILTGRPSLHCLNNNCGPNETPTLVNEFPNDSTVISGWETISKVIDTSLAAANIGRHTRSKQWQSLKIPNTDSAEEDEFGDPEYRSDRETHRTVINYFKRRQSTFTWISYGDPDEWAHQTNVTMYWSSLNSVDQYIEELIQLAEPNTVFIVCPDHGRGDRENWGHHGWDFASGRVWILIKGPEVPAAGFVSYNRIVHSSDIYPTILEITKGKVSSRSLLHYQ